MRSGPATVLVAVLLGCSGGTQSAPSPVDAPDEEPAAASDASSEPTVSRHGDVDVDDDRVAPEVCADQRPIVTTQVGSVNTIVVPSNAGEFEGDVEATPAAGCPGDTVSFAVSVLNISGDPQVFAAGRGLIFYSGGMANWSVSSLSDLGVVVQPGERVETTVAGTIPPVAPGTYRVGPEGAGFAAEVTVLDPTVD